MSKVHLVVLGMLNEKPMHGYEFKYYLEERSLEHWSRVNLPAIYKALQSLEDKGHITGKKEVEGNNPPRTVYRITESGRKFLRKMVTNNLMNPKHKPDFWIAIAFMIKVVTYETARRAIELQLEQEDKEHRDIKFASMKQQTDVPFNGRVLIQLGLGFHETEKKCLTALLEEMAKPENREKFIEG